MQPGPCMAHDVFISYSEKDKTTADAVCAMLESEGIRCWIAPRDVTPGLEWSECIVDAIEQARVMVLIFSDNANNSVQVHREVEHADHRSVKVLPMRIEDVPPARALEYFIEDLQWLDALTSPLDAHQKSLAGAVKALFGQAQPGEELPKRDAAAEADQESRAKAGWKATGAPAGAG